VGVRACRDLGQGSRPRDGRQAGHRGLHAARGPRPLGVPDQYGHALGYGSSAAAGYGILVGSLRKRSPLYGLPFGAAVWLSSYLILPEGGLYKPIWEYDLKTLGGDLSAHLCYGAGTGVAFWLLTSVP
jgi:hypothetical protein